MRPIDADALITQMEERQAFLVKEYGYRDHYTRGYEEAVDKVIAAPTIEQPQWISCSERLPTEGVSIEMFFPVSQSICLGYYKKIAKQTFWCVRFPDGTGRLGDENPTHWRYRYITETPQPHKENTDGNKQ